MKDNKKAVGNENATAPETGVPPTVSDKEAVGNENATELETGTAPTVSEKITVTIKAQSKKSTTQPEMVVEEVVTVELDKEIIAFFKENPDAPSVLRVDKSLFLAAHVGVAESYARTYQKSLEEIFNPNRV
jgi:uncharacterized protein (DUF4415 family)